MRTGQASPSPRSAEYMRARKKQPMKPCTILHSKRHGRIAHPKCAQMANGAAAWEFVRGTSFHRRCLCIKGDFPATFLPTFASNGRIYAFSPFLAVDAIYL